MDIPGFNDPALRNVVEENDETISARGALLDQISADIKALEAYLQERGIQIEATASLGGGAGELRWTKAEPDRWRIIFTDTIGSRPLIETPWRTRIACREVLPSLVSALARTVKDAEHVAQRALERAGRKV